MPAKIIIGGDICPTETNFNLFAKGDIETLIGAELIAVLDSADFTIFNLEVPLTNDENPIKKFGPNLVAPTNTVNGIKLIAKHFVSLANNHVMDQGPQGLESTIKQLDTVGIAHSGTGRNIDEASQPFITDVNDIRLGIYCCSEHEFSIADAKHPGANPYDPLESMDHVMELNNDCDFVIVLYHGGKEHYRYPSPGLQKRCRKFIDKGANLVICQHSHCIGCEEIWGLGRIVYGQGNFLFDHSESEFWKTALLIMIDIENTGNFSIHYIPLSKDQMRVRLAKDNAEEIMRGFNCRSKEILENGFVESNYREFSRSLQKNYWRVLSGNRGIIFKILNKLCHDRLLMHSISKRYKTKNTLALENYVECETHRELLLTLLKDQNS